MTVKELKQILTSNNIPEDARLMSDSGWECGPTDMDGVYYNPKENIVVFDQCYKYSDYNNKPEWIRVEVKKEKEDIYETIKEHINKEMKYYEIDKIGG